jgi:6-phosphogluconolactonase/glucosamine-6-phosphate isomerase/deaminase
MKNGISLINTSEKQGTDIAAKLLYNLTDKKTVLFMSGGKTPARLYSRLAEEHKLKVGAAAMVDERYGKPLHDRSNELMIEKSGLIDYFRAERVPFYRILDDRQSIGNTARQYRDMVKNLFSDFPKSVAILGIGEDGHTAGIAPDRADFKNPLFLKEQSSLLVSHFIDPKPMSADGSSMPPYGFGERITMTIKGLLKIDVLIILVFGQNKQAALSKLFEEGPVEEIPARFIKSQGVAHKALIITDRKI